MFTEHLKKAYTAVRDDYLKSVSNMNRHSLLLQIITSLVSAAIMIALFFLMIFIVIKNRLSACGIAGYIQTFMYIQYEIQDLAAYGRWYFILIGSFQNFFELIDWEAENKTVTEKKKIILTEK